MKILFVVIDTLRADHLSAYGYARPTSPNLDALARNGILFENFFAGNIPTQPAFTSIYTSQLGITHGVVQHGSPDSQLSDETPVLPAILRAKGYTTAAVDNLYNHKPWFARGYDFYINPHTSQLITADEVNAKAVPWIQEHAAEDFFLFVHYWDPHTPYLPPEAYRNLYYKGDKNNPANRSMEPVKRQLVYPFFKKWHYDRLEPFTDIEYVVAQYDAEITYVDNEVGKLLDALADAGIADETVVIVTSDHGENMTEHELYFDHAGLYEANIHVPLIIKIPGDPSRGKRIAAMAQHIDLAPTVLELAGVEPPESMEGQSLVPLIAGREEDGHDAIYAAECTWQAKWAIRTSEWKLIKTVDPGLYGAEETELYHLSADPGEERNVFAKQSQIADALELRLMRWIWEQLGGRPDPVRAFASRGFPPKHWVARALQDMNVTWDEWVEKQKYI